MKRRLSRSVTLNAPTDRGPNRARTGRHPGCEVGRLRTEERSGGAFRRHHHHDGGGGYEEQGDRDEEESVLIASLVRAPLL